MQNNTEIFEQIKEIGYRAWQRNLFSGFSGNISLRCDDICHITNSGTTKGNLMPNDMGMANITTKKIISGNPSTELAMHLAIYDNCHEALAILHTHPINLLALELYTSKLNFLDLPLFEAQIAIKKLKFIPPLEPGSNDLACNVGLAHRDFEATWLSQHGLVCHANNLNNALALSESLESLANIQLLAMKK